MGRVPRRAGRQRRGGFARCKVQGAGQRGQPGRQTTGHVQQPVPGRRVVLRQQPHPGDLRGDGQRKGRVLPLLRHGHQGAVRPAHPQSFQSHAGGGFRPGALGAGGNAGGLFGVAPAVAAKVIHHLALRQAGQHRPQQLAGGLIHRHHQKLFLRHGLGCRLGQAQAVPPKAGGAQQLFQFIRPLGGQVQVFRALAAGAHAHRLLAPLLQQAQAGAALGRRLPQDAHQRRLFHAEQAQNVHPLLALLCHLISSAPIAFRPGRFSQNPGCRA